MKRIVIAAAAAFAMMGAAQAQTTQPLYGELGLTFLQFKGDGPDLNPLALRGIVGYDFHPNVAVEGMLAIGVKDDDAQFSESGFTFREEVKLRHAFGVYVKPKFNVTPQFEAFARLGYARTKVKGTVTETTTGASESFSDSDGDFSYGLGVNYKFNPRMSVNVDYMRYFDKDGGKIDGWTVGVGYRF